MDASSDWGIEVNQTYCQQDYTPLIYWQLEDIRCNWKQAEKNDDIGKGGNWKYLPEMEQEKMSCVTHEKRTDRTKEDNKIADLKPIKSVDIDNTYRFLGVLENTKQDDKQAARTYIKRLPIIWSRPLSDNSKVIASNQYSLPVLTYSCGHRLGLLQWSNNLTEKQERLSWRMEETTRRVQMQFSTRQYGGRGLKSVENEYKNIKIKETVKLYSNADLTMAAVRSFKELAVQKGQHSIIKDATKCEDELGL